MRKLIPLIGLVLGLGAGIGAALFLGPAPDPAAASETHAGDDGKTKEGKKPAKKAGHDGEEKDAEAAEFVKLNNQFVVPVVSRERVESLVVLSLSLETAGGVREKIYAHEPKLRDAFLQVLFDHANMGGFSGAFTRPETLDPLRTALREVAQAELGEAVVNVLIVDIARQDS